MARSTANSLDSDTSARLYVEHADELRRFLIGVLRDAPLAQDCVQAAFAKLLTHGGGVRAESRKAWLFRVAYHEALAVRRRQAVGKRVLEQVGKDGESLASGIQNDAAETLVSRETIDGVRRALAELPQNQRDVVRMRMYENKTFRLIAAELDIPIGTALARMRTALKKLRQRLESE